MGEEGSGAVLVLLALLKVYFGRYVPSKSDSTAPCQSSLHLTIAFLSDCHKKIEGCPLCCCYIQHMLYFYCKSPSCLLLTHDWGFSQQGRSLQQSQCSHSHQT